MMQRLETIAAGRTGVGKWGGDLNQNPSNSDFQIGFDFYVLHSNRTQRERIDSDISEYTVGSIPPADMPITRHITRFQPNAGMNPQIELAT